ncbi:Zinc finger CCCH domain-containing protein 53 [Linum perenne]
MDSYEATKTVFSRIQAMDPDNASKIMGYLLLQDQGDNEMIRLAFGPESLLHSLILQAKSHLGLPISPTTTNSSSSSSSASTPSSAPAPAFPRPSALSMSRISGGFEKLTVNPSSPSTNSWQLLSPNHGGNNNNNNSSPSASSSLSYAVNGGGNGNGVGSFRYGDLSGGDEYQSHGDQQFSFLSESSKVADQVFDKMPDSALFSPTGDISLMRSKSSVLHQQQKLAAAAQFLAASGSPNFPYSRGATGFSPLGGGPSARQIYLTFPADSTFREEDVSSYFSIYGPVQDVRIPYQQKRMFGFVTFVYPETVNLILAKGNPHFVCDSRVLVKPYKEKGKILEKKQLQMERGGEFSPSACSSPTGLDSREPFDLHLGSRMFYNTQEMLLRKKIEEQADLQQAIELHGRRLMSLQLLDLKNHHRQQLIRSLSNGSPLSSPRTTPVLPVPEDNGVASVNAVVGHDQEKYFTEINDVHESFEHVLPENLFNSPKKASIDHLDHHKTAFSASLELHHDNIPTTTNNSAINLTTPLKSCFPQMPRLSSGHGTIGMKS